MMKHLPVSTDSAMLKIVPLLVIFAGIISTNTYLLTIRSGHTISIFLLLVGILLQSIGILLSLELALRLPSYRALFLVCAAALALSIVFMQYARFDIPFKSDAIIEYATAVHQSTGWNPANPLRPDDPYDIYLSVTILPLIIARVLGVTILQVFSCVFLGIISFMPFTFYLPVCRFFKNSNLPLLWLAILPQFYFFQVYTESFRASFALLFLFLLVYSLCLKTRRGTFLSAIFGLALSYSYFVVAYFGVVILMLFALAPVVFKRFGKEYRSPISLKSLFVLILEIAIWLTYVGLSEGYFEYYQLANFIYTNIAGQAALPVFSTYVVSTTQGPLVTSWFDMQFVLIGIGALVMLYKSLFSPKDAVPAWTLAGGLALLMIVATLFAPGVGRLLGFDRIASYSLPFLMVFMAVPLLWARRRFQVGFYLFAILMLSMNLLIPAASINPMYTPSSSISAQRAENVFSGQPRSIADLQGGLFISNHLPISQFRSIATDSIEGSTVALLGINDFYIQQVLVANGTLNPTVSFFLLSNVFFNSGGDFVSNYTPGSVSASYLYISPIKLVGTAGLDILYSDGSVVFEGYAGRA